MVMREKNGVDMGEVFEIYCWVCLARACDAWSEVDVVASVEEIGLFGS